LARKQHRSMSVSGKEAGSGGLRAAGCGRARERSWGRGEGDLPEFLRAKPLAIELWERVRVSVGRRREVERVGSARVRRRGRDGPEGEELCAGRDLCSEPFEVLAGEFLCLVLVWLRDDRGDEGGLEVVGEVASMEVGRVVGGVWWWWVCGCLR